MGGGEPYSALLTGGREKVGGEGYTRKDGGFGERVPSGKSQKAGKRILLERSNFCARRGVLP